jgi:YVTN family beta-propeller protein
MVMPTRDGKMAFASNSDSDSIAAIELASGKVTVIPVRARPQGGAFSPDGSLLYITCSNGNAIDVIDVKGLKVVRSIAVGKGPGRIAVTPDGNTLVYNLQKEPAVGFADVASGKQVAMVPLSGDPLSLTMTRDGQRAFTGIQSQDKVVYVSVRDRKIERVIDLPKGSGPDPVIPLSGK